MNHCRDCNSEYQTPGTCNCFAPGGKRHAAPLPVPVVPYVPWCPAPWYQPPVTPFPWWGTITVYANDATAQTVTWTRAQLDDLRERATGRLSYTSEVPS